MVTISQETAKRVRERIETYCLKKQYSIVFSEGGVLEGLQVADSNAAYEGLPLFDFRASFQGRIQEGRLEFVPDHASGRFATHVRLEHFEQAFEVEKGGRASARLPMLYIGLELALEGALEASRQCLGAKKMIGLVAPSLPARSGKPVSMRLDEEQKILRKRKRWA